MDRFGEERALAYRLEIRGVANDRIFDIARAHDGIIYYNHHGRYAAWSLNRMRVPSGAQPTG